MRTRKFTFEINWPLGRPRNITLFVYVSSLPRKTFRIKSLPTFCNEKSSLHVEESNILCNSILQIGSHGVRIHDILFPNSLRPKSKYIFLYCSIRRWIFEILKKLKILQTTSYFGQIVSKKDKLTIHIFMKNSKNNNIILGFNFHFYVFIWF